jgi:hypothetical protein
MDATNRHQRTASQNFSTQTTGKKYSSVIDSQLEQIELMPAVERPVKLAEMYKELANCKEADLPMALQRLAMSSFYLNDEDARNLHQINCQGFELLDKACSVDDAADHAITLAEVMKISAMNRPKEQQIELLTVMAETAIRLNIKSLNTFAFREMHMLVTSPDPETRTNLLIKAVPMTSLLKPENQLRQITWLYENACIDEPLRLRALESIATVTHLLPETRESVDLVNRVNQEIYLLRLAQE